VARFRLTPAAQSDLELIWDYTVENFGSNQALIYTDGLDSACRLLAEAPLINRPRTEYEPEIRIYPHAEHLLLYVLNDGVVEIIRILHATMDVDSQLNNDKA
jgi:toxin ParE1/3/4